MGDLIKEIIITTDSKIEIIIRSSFDMDMLGMASAILVDMKMKPLKDAVGKVSYKIVDNLDQIPDAP